MSFEPSGEICPLCRGTTLIPFSALPFDSPQNSEFSIIECSSCGFAWQWPLVRSTVESAEHFSNNYAAAEQNTYFDKERKQAICDMEMKFIASLTPSEGRLLDIGSGDGTFCEFAYKNGWTAYGIDPVGPSRQEQTATGELRLINGDISMLQSDQRFDIITLWDVIEHLEKPLEIIEACKTHLNPDGWLVLETGNFQSVDRVNSGNQWWCYQHDHRWYFAPGALSEALERIGFERFTICERTLRPWVKPMAKFKGPSPLNYLKRSIRHPWLILSNLGEFRKLAELSKKSPDVAHLPIFTMAAQLAR